MVLASVAFVLGIGAPAQAVPARPGHGVAVTAADKSDRSDRGDRADRHNRSDDRHDGRYYDGRYYDGRYAGCGYYPECDPYDGGYGGYYGGGYHPGYGYGCGYEYPCSQGYDRQNSECTKYNGREAKHPDNCRYDPSCDCWYKTSEAPKQRG
jgi:hypothetical protein